ncbi:MAG: helix-turn-helix transcriptional regulator [Saprospiraceae bacterium]|nr:helix-turn-helix transcriptional regulator [Saprospiraceae bacterium]
MAARMLSETDMQITRICYESGYNSLANFNSQFKSLMGQSPSDYRNSFR